MGLINAQQAAQADQAVDQITDTSGGGDILAKAKDKFMSMVPQGMEDVIQRILVAGRKLLYSKETNGTVEEMLSTEQDPVSAIGEGVVGLMGILMRESRNTIPPKVVVPAMLLFLVDTLDYLKQTGRAKGDAADLEKASEAMVEAMMEGAGVPPDALGSVFGKMQESMKDPAVAEKMKQHMGGGNGL